ncbi:phytanoyl-CoA dioxygenase [Klebsiella pneumoniae]|uniref:Phytanoyl-CoA dioxygenase n=1 Tax=Klebsiella pneumoniae TaxID=573 RepID=A0A377V0P9_KLEPN|nr:phytanoyl-CoA dioxygenase [Klebsiella pneumoniae]
MHRGSFLVPTSAPSYRRRCWPTRNRAHPDEIVFAAPAGSVMIYNAHAWHGGTRNREGSRRRVLHGLYIDRADTPQQDQRRWLTPETASRLTPAQKWLLDVE